MNLGLRCSEIHAEELVRDFRVVELEDERAEAQREAGRQQEKGWDGVTCPSLTRGFLKQTRRLCFSIKVAAGSCVCDSRVQQFNHVSEQQKKGKRVHNGLELCCNWTRPSIMGWKGCQTQETLLQKLVIREHDFRPYFFHTRRSDQGAKVAGPSGRLAPQVWHATPRRALTCNFAPSEECGTTEKCPSLC